MLINALKSIFGQTYQNYEVIVINDGGSDVRYLFEGLPGDRIRYLQHGANRGLPAARNTGIKAARGTYSHIWMMTTFFIPTISKPSSTSWNPANTRSHTRMLTEHSRKCGTESISL